MENKGSETISQLRQLGFLLKLK